MEKTFTNTVVEIKLFSDSLEISNIIWNFFAEHFLSVFWKVWLHQTKTNAFFFVCLLPTRACATRDILPKHPVLAWTERCRKDHMGRDWTTRNGAWRLKSDSHCNVSQTNVASKNFPSLLRRCIPCGTRRCDTYDASPYLEAFFIGCRLCGERR